MRLSPEKLIKLQEIAAKIQDEYDRDKFTVLVAELMAVFEETERQKQIA
jgi:hypothetical protein